MATQRGPKIPTSGLVLMLDAADKNSYPDTGTTWYDLIGNNTGTLTNGPTFNSSNGGSIVFDGTNDYVGITSFSHPSTDSFTISFWSKSAKKSSTNFQSFISSRQLTSPYTGILITEDSTANRSDYLRVQLNSTTAVNQYNSGTLTIPDNIFCNIVISVNRTTNLMNWYINATFDSQYDITGLGNISSTHALEIGRDEAYIPNSNAFLTGNVAQVCIYNKALSATEVLQNYNVTRTRFGL